MSLRQHSFLISHRKLSFLFVSSSLAFNFSFFKIPVGKIASGKLNASA